MRPVGRSRIVCFLVWINYRWSVITFVTRTSCSHFDPIDTVDLELRMPTQQAASGIPAVCIIQMFSVVAYLVKCHYQGQSVCNSHRHLIVKLTQCFVDWLNILIGYSGVFFYYFSDGVQYFVGVEDLCSYHRYISLNSCCISENAGAADCDSLEG